jgi:transcriptional regulator with XRE-family HTH domain
MTIDLPALMRVVDDKRHDRRITWRQVAEETGITPSNMSRMRHGKIGPNLDTFAKLLHWLSLSPQELGELMKTIIRET